MIKWEEKLSLVSQTSVLSEMLPMLPLFIMLPMLPLLLLLPILPFLAASIAIFTLECSKDLAFF